MQHDLDPGLTQPKGLQYRRQDAVAGGHRAVQIDLTGELLVPPHLPAQVLPLGDTTPGVLQKRTASRRQPHAALIPLQQLLAQLLLQPLHRAADSADTQVQALGAAAEVQRISDR